MFGLKRKAQQEAAATEAKWAAAGSVVYDRLVAELKDVLAAAVQLPGMTDGDQGALTENAKGVLAGLNAVLLDNVDAYGPHMKPMPQPVRCGATTAHAARNHVFVTGTFDWSHARGNFAFGLGLARDAV
jgi:hypothetical protein